MSYLEDEFCDIIEKARQGLGIKRETLAIKTGISESELSLLERGDKIPSLRQTVGLAKVLGLDGERLWRIVIKGWMPAPPSSDLGERVIMVTGDVGGYEVKAYILLGTDFKSVPKEAVLIDTACNPSGILNSIKKHNLTLSAIFLTHLHGDHTGGMEKILQEYPVDVYAGEAIGHLSTGVNSMVKDKDCLRFGNCSIRCIWTPGHTYHSFCYDSDGICFVGDTVFAGSIGRSNPAALYQTHLKSVRDKILSLSEETLLLPGHGPITTVGEEKTNNPFFV